MGQVDGCRAGELAQGALGEAVAAVAALADEALVGGVDDDGGALLGVGQEGYGGLDGVYRADDIGGDKLRQLVGGDVYDGVFAMDAGVGKEGVDTAGIVGGQLQGALQVGARASGALDEADGLR